ncbi:CPBP family intramembrane glutamic endopeptidase [Leucobacter aridicollis]|uniref:CPBP family intramembrane glutamic endopeptidase n=1 Tax=Leucobacter aridicollis TaxID=283878 RepID=UPI00216A163B|nr:CPBP family intramembrane glutamic endopeptidase [Leucobacter aridicollis]MCS3426462.1 membrane protease YdiL (CAAX protease family) [Leucobacter aridicollis]
MTRRPPFARRVGAAAWRVAVAVGSLWVGLVILTAVVPPHSDPSDAGTLAIRIGAGAALSALTLLVIAVLARYADGLRLNGVGLTSLRSGWRLAVWGALLWAVPAAASFGVLALFGRPLRATGSAGELVQTVGLVLVAVLLAEAIPEEAIFRGYVTTALGAVTRGWGTIAVQAVLFAVFAGVIRQSWDPTDLSLFLAMGVGFGYLRMIAGSVWASIGFHTAFQTGSQLVLTHSVVEFSGSVGLSMLALGMVPFTVAAIVVSSAGVPRWFARS